MKKVCFLMGVAALYAGTLFAQPEKGVWITSLNGSFGAGGIKSANYSYNRLQLKPELLIMLKRNFAVGFVLGYDHSMSRMKNNQTAVDTRIRELHLLAGPVLRKYFGNLKFRPYAEISAGVNYSMLYTKISGESGSPFSQTGAFIRPALGMSYWLTDKVSFNLSAGTDLMKSSHPAMEINLGISVLLGK